MKLFNSYSWLPGRCLLCRRGSGRELDLCAACQASLPSISARCRQCGLATVSDCQQCGQCLQTPPSFQRCIAPVEYLGDAIALIQRLKYQRDMPAIRVMASLLTAELQRCYSADWPALLLPVPLHRWRLLRRGYNQAGLLANTLGKALQLPVNHLLLRRTRATPPQQGLRRPQRLANLNDAFSLRYTPGASHVALIDDVVTTGATAAVVASLLLQHGVERVDIWCLARTPTQRNCTGNSRQ